MLSKRRKAQALVVIAKTYDNSIIMVMYSAYDFLFNLYKLYNLIFSRIMREFKISIKFVKGKYIIIFRRYIFPLMGLFKEAY